jgi:hypothetical protein
MSETPTPVQDYGDAIAHCELQLKRLGIGKRHPTIILWLDINGYSGDWNRLEYLGFVDLYRYLTRCEP